MGSSFRFSDLYRAPDINPINRKAHSIPFLNPINMYGRVFFFSWISFMIAFWGWYTFPPLASDPVFSTCSPIFTGLPSHSPAVNLYPLLSPIYTISHLVFSVDVRELTVFVVDNDDQGRLEAHN